MILSKVAVDVWYSVDDSETRHRLHLWKWKSAGVNLSDSEDFELIAKECADEYHSEHDGWESSWPVTMTLYASEDGEPVCFLTVDREIVPEFSARRIKAP